MYSTKNIKTAKDKPSYIPAGIVDNLVFTDVKYDTTENSNEFIAFYFESVSGDRFAHTEWPVRLDKPMVAMNEEEVKTYKRRVEDQLSRIKQIIETFCPRDSYKEIEATSFKEYAEQVVKLLQTKFGQKVRGKIVYNDRNFTTFPRNPNAVFIEPMTIPKEESRILILSGDKLNKSQMDREERKTNPLENSPIESTESYGRDVVEHKDQLLF